MTRLYDAALAPTGIGIKQYAILARLERYGPMRLGAFADRLAMDRSTLGHLLRPLRVHRRRTAHRPADGGTQLRADLVLRAARACERAHPWPFTAVPRTA